MTSYSPMKITGMTTGLVQEREEFLLPNDAYPILENAYVWRERIKRKQGFEILGRFRRILTADSLGNYTTINGTNTILIFTQLGVNVSEPNASIELANISNITITFAAPISQSLTATTATSTLTVGGAGAIQSASINYATGVVTITANAGVGPAAATITGAYYPGLPVMGLRNQDLNAINNQRTIGFDTVYAYFFTGGGWQEFIPGTVWTGNDFNFFWSTNYWVDNANLKLFWVTNFSGTGGDPIRYTNTVTWIDFGASSPTGTGQINVAGDFLNQCLCLLPFRSRLIAFNTYEGQTLLTSLNFPQRIRWAAIGNPLVVDSAVPPVTRGAWRDDLRGQGGFIDIPTNEQIVSVGFVRDNLVIYCSRSTWQLRYTGRSISPFQLEKVNSELGAEATFSAVQFDTSLVGIGDKGIVECDSFKSNRIDIKIPDLVFNFNDANNGTQRVYGIRDFVQRLAYWIYPSEIGSVTDVTYPNRRLVYNYENDSWAIFTDSLTALGTFLPSSGRKWNNTKIPWNQANFPWFNRPQLIPDPIGGNQQGYVFYLDSKVSNDPSLFITAITGNSTTPTVITSPNHNLTNFQVVTINNIPIGTPFAQSLDSFPQGVITAISQAPQAVVTSAGHNLVIGQSVEIDGVVGMTQLNSNIYIVTATSTNTFTIDVASTLFTPYISGGIWTNQLINAFGVVIVDVNNFQLYKYSPISDDFTIPQLDPPDAYIGGGEIAVRDGFYIQSKKFNFIDEGQSIQIGYLDVLMEGTDNGAISLNMFVNYNDDEPVNTLPQNNNQSPEFFNSIVSTSNPNSATDDPFQSVVGTKYWQRVYCPTRGNFLTISWTLSNAQLVQIEQESNVQIDAQVIWQRPAGRMSNR